MRQHNLKQSLNCTYLQWRSWGLYAELQAAVALPTTSCPETHSGTSSRYAFHSRPFFFHTQHYFVNQRKIHSVNSLHEHFIVKTQCRLLSTDKLIAQLHTCTPSSNYWSASLLSLQQLVTSSSVPVRSSNYWPALLLSPPQCVRNSQPQNSDC